MYKQFTDEQINKYEFSSHKTYTLNQTQVTRKQFLSESLDETADRYYKFARINLYLSGSDYRIRHDDMQDNPQVYISEVGLYDDNGDLMAIGRLSSALEKNFSSEAVVKVRLTY